MRQWRALAADSYALRRRLNPYVLFLCLLAWGGLSLCGFSTSKRTFLSDRDFIDAAIRRVIQRYPPSLRAISTEREDDSTAMAIPYLGVEQFRDINPACCEFVAGDTEGTGPSPIGYLLGDEWRVVRVSYQVRFRDALGASHARQATDYVMLSRDGNVVWSH